MSSRYPSQNQIAIDLAEDVCQRIACAGIDALQDMDSDLSGDDSGLQNVWDEICVQVQNEYSVAWNVYLETIKVILDCSVVKLKQYERDAIWLQTDAASDWEFEDESERFGDPVNNVEIREYILENYLLVKACRWSNQAIKDYHNRRLGWD